MTDIEASPEIESVKPKKTIGLRHLQFFLLWLTLIVFFSQRTAMSVAIIAMTEEEPPHPDIPTYPDWGYRDVILSSFFWGYILPQIGAGQLSEYFGPKWFLIGTGALGSLFNILLPLMAANFNEGGVMACRVIQGISQGFIFPCIHYVISQWSPLFERSRVTAFIYSGTSLGNVVAMPISGAIADSKLGWPALFYFFGGFGVVWAVLFGIFGSDSPTKHPRVSEEELRYIQSTNLITRIDKKIPTPWKHMLTSLPVWAILVALLGQSWGYFTLLTQIPTYMNSIMNFNMKENGLLSALPYVVMFLMGFVTGPIADKLISSSILSVGATRKLVTSIGNLGPAVALFSLGFVEGEQRALAITLLVLSGVLIAFNHPGSLVNSIDIAPDHASTLNGITNGASVITSILGPLSIEFYSEEKEDPFLWKKIFWVAAGIYVFSGLFFATFSSGEVQKWNNFEKETAKIDKEKTTREDS